MFFTVFVLAANKGLNLLACFCCSDARMEDTVRSRMVKLDASVVATSGREGQIVLGYFRGEKMKYFLG